MKRRQNLVKRVLRFIKEHNLVEPDKPLVVGVSGGPDSVCLLHILAAHKRALKTALHVAHLNHSLRGTESDSDADYVKSLASKLGIPAIIEKRDVAAYRKRHRLSLEEAAREVRYAFFTETAESLSTDTVAAGHTADDQIETILMHLLRGTGLAGLRGMQPLGSWRTDDGTPLRLIRPLLESRREETEEYCAAQGLYPRIDSSNLLHNQLRNKVRHQLLPLLRDYNADVDNAVLRLSRAADADLAFIDEHAAQVWKSVVHEREGGMEIDRAKFSALHPALKRHLIRYLLQNLLGDLQDIESIHIESVVDAMSKTAGKRLSLPRGLSFRTDYSHGSISAGDADDCPLPSLEGEHRLNIPGETDIGGWRIESSIIENKPIDEEDDRWKACMDFDVVGTVLTVRRRRRGDRFRPLGMDATKKLQDFMVDAKIPRHWRRQVPIVCSSGHIVWVAGWRIDHRVSVTPSTGRILCLKFKNKPGCD
jgi:tRNA(Ile)-lysidine synthase